jgi:hypothetical protein
VELALIIAAVQRFGVARAERRTRKAKESGVLPRAGDILRVTRAASVQFIEPMLFRVIRVHDWPTYDGWAWLDGYQLNAAGDAVERRSIFVQLHGLQTAHTGSAGSSRSRAAVG